MPPEITTIYVRAITVREIANEMTRFGVTGTLLESKRRIVSIHMNLLFQKLAPVGRKKILIDEPELELRCPLRVESYRGPGSECPRQL